MAMPPISRRGAYTRSVMFALAHILLLAVTIRPLHVHELRPAGSDPQIVAANGSSFCFDCTFGTEQIDFTRTLAVVSHSSFTFLELPLTSQPIAVAAISTACRAPPTL